MQGFNRYYPPTYDGKSTINQLNNSHALGSRARKLHQGILIVRFELPYDIFCDSCSSHVAQGVRYNAEKKRVGSYYSTPIWSFRMKCHLCSAWFEIHTDPQNTAYKIISGARKRAQEWDTALAGNIVTSEEDRERIENDPIFRLEKEMQDKKLAEERKPLLSKIEEANKRQWADPYSVSQKLRRSFRQEKKLRESKNAADQKILDRNGLSIKLLDESPQDLIAAKKVEFKRGREELAKKKAALGVKRSLDAGVRGEVYVNERIKNDPFLNTEFSKGRKQSTKECGSNEGLVGYHSN